MALFLSIGGDVVAARFHSPEHERSVGGHWRFAAKAGIRVQHLNSRRGGAMGRWAEAGKELEAIESAVK